MRNESDESGQNGLDGTQDIKSGSADKDNTGSDDITAAAEEVIEKSAEETAEQTEETDGETKEETDDNAKSIVIRRVRSEVPEETTEKTRKERGFLYSILDTLRFICLGLVIGILLVVFVIQRNDVYGESMSPTLHGGDAVFVEMITSYTTSYQRGEIVTINATGMPGYDKKEKIIKRIVGLPGETVTVKDGGVYINGVLLAEPYLPEGVPTYANEETVAKGYDSVTLGANEYYCLGDNRGASLDSRILGPFSTDRIKAHVIVRIFPFDGVKLF